MSPKARVTIKLKRPNPLFETWLTEWRDEAKARDSKMQYCFSAALQSLKKYPLPLETGRDCKILKGFGDKLCMMLDEKLKKHRRDGVGAEVEVPKLETFQATTEQEKQRKTKDLSNSKGIYVNEITTNKAEKSDGNKKYTPQYRSGGYAILVSLYKNTIGSDAKGFLTKDEIIKDARFYCDVSFTKSAPGTYYTAWSSMRTLIVKNLVNKEGNPAKFSLTDDGILVARKFYSETIENTDKQNLGNIETLESNEMSINDRLENIERLKNNRLENNDRLQNDERLEKNDGLFTEKMTEMSKSNRLENNDRLKNNRRLGDNDRLENDERLENENSGRNEMLGNYDKLFSNFSDEIPDISDLISGKIIDLTEDENENIINETNEKTGKKLTQKSNSEIRAEPTETVIFEPDTFEIVLLVDTAETSGTKQAQDDPIIADLLHLSTNFEIRHLKVGDYVWICRHRDTKLELVLPYIIERKRTDDFGHSIKDGRYHEQKFRLSQCGIQNVVYLVESYGNNTHTGLPMSTLMQAATNTMLHDGFQIKFSENLRSTAHYLNTMSKILIKNYSKKMIMSCPKDNLERVAFDADLIPAMTFTEFSKIGSKYKIKVTLVLALFVEQFVTVGNCPKDAYFTTSDVKMATTHASEQFPTVADCSANKAVMKLIHNN